ncbi:MAG: PDR/VanB family oxidoreductase [Zoogloeaceae bacterium]|jgi:vanillate O-demethylase ferredoxin subunit|nr:PDR/VanB family oxidoreductase [Zoogloeaceae bacterium]
MTSHPTLRLAIVKRAVEGGGTVLLDLAHPDGVPLPPCTAGAHVELVISPTLTRPYSLCGDPADRSRYRLGILNDPASRGGSRAVFEQFHEGRIVEVSTPRNLFPLDPAATKTLLIGGGIGITPMLAMAYALTAAGKDFELHYSAKSRAVAAFLPELAAAPFANSVFLHFSDEARADLAAVIGTGAAGKHVYTCGPRRLMDAVIATARAQGYAEANIHSEYFQVEVDNTGGGFEVVAKKSGKTLSVAPGESLLHALTAAGIAMQKSCEQGVCGACLADVLEGVPDHRDKYLTDDEKAGGDLIVTCCSRAKSPRLVLDV